MARTGEKENSAAQKQDMADQSQAFTTGQGAIAQTRQNLDTLNRGGQVAANPYLNPTYLSAVNRLQSGALNAENNAAATTLRQNNLRTGGMNNTGTEGAIKSLALQKMQLGDQLSAGRAANDWQKNIGYQQQMAQAPLSIAGAESPYFSTSTSGQDSALGNMSQEGIAAYGPWMAAIQAAGGAASAAIPLCPARGSRYLMADGSEKLVEDLRVGDLLAGIDGQPETIEEIQTAKVPVLRVRTEDGHQTRNSRTHAFALPFGGFVVAMHALGSIVRTAKGNSKIVSNAWDSDDEVFNVITNGSHTYRADGIWSLGVGEAERHVSMQEWGEIGDKLAMEVAN